MKRNRPPASPLEERWRRRVAGNLRGRGGRGGVRPGRFDAAGREMDGGDGADPGIALDFQAASIGVNRCEEYFRSLPHTVASHGYAEEVTRAYQQIRGGAALEPDLARVSNLEEEEKACLMAAAGRAFNGCSRYSSRPFQ